MPNRCYNVVTAKWESEKIAEYEKFIDEVEKSKDTGLLSTIDPNPAELNLFKSPVSKEFGEDEALFKARVDRCMQLYWAKDRYEWRTKNWWTKRDVDIYVWLPSWHKNEVVITFDSARSPPEEAIAKLSKKFPDLKFTIEYSESGSMFSWWSVYIDWELDEQEYFADPWFGEWKACTECWEEHDPDDECMWSEEHPWLCVDCAELLDANTWTDAKDS